MILHRLPYEKLNVVTHQYCRFVFAIRLAMIIELCFVFAFQAKAQIINIDNTEHVLEIGQVSDNSLRVVLKPIGTEYIKPPFIEPNFYERQTLRISRIDSTIRKTFGNLLVRIKPDPLRVNVTNTRGEFIQEISFLENGEMAFVLDSLPVLGMGEGGPKPDKETNWRELDVEYDRRGRFHHMRPRWQSDAYGSRNPVPLLIGTRGWGLFAANPWVQVDLTLANRGLFIPIDRTDVTTPQSQKNQGLDLGKGIPPKSSISPGLKEIFIFDAHNPSEMMRDITLITGAAVMPPKWALGYMQSHRTLENDNQITDIVETFRRKNIPLDAVIYLGTGFTPRGWNKQQPSFEFNPEVFERSPKNVIDEIHRQNAKIVLHMVPWDRNKLPSLHGTIPIESDEKIDSSHIFKYWQQHNELMSIGIDAFWPDEGDWFDLYERLKRHQMYYQGPVFTRPNIRPWSLHRNGYIGIVKWGGWIWSGDTQSSWKTLEAQIAVGINSSLSISPYWGSDIGGFYPNPEKTGELYARWFQFGAFCPSFRSHGRTWNTTLPWGWGLKNMGPRENNSNNDFISQEVDSIRNPLRSEMNNPSIEPVIKKYAELRYRLSSYNYTLAWEAREKGMPIMRSMWLHYPKDNFGATLGNQYLWGPGMLIAPVFKKEAKTRNVYLPSGEWYDWWTNQVEEGPKIITKAVDLATMPIYIPSGTILPLDPVRQFTDQKIHEPMTLKIYTGSDGKFTLYEDDGSSLDYLKGINKMTNFTWHNTSKVLAIEPSVHSGTFQNRKKEIFKVQLVPEGTVRVVTYVGEPLKVKMD